MSYMTPQELNRYAGEYEKHAARQYVITLSDDKPKAQSTVFLSHSHRDVDYVERIITFLGSLGVKVYIDRLDTEMPTATCAATAIRIKQKIKENKKFLVLVSPRSVESRWVPWELGYADGIKGLSNIATLPVTDFAGNFSGNEYISMYPTIRKSDQGSWCFFPPGQSGTRLKSWLTE